GGRRFRDLGAVDLDATVAYLRCGLAAIGSAVVDQIDPFADPSVIVNGDVIAQAQLLWQVQHLLGQAEKMLDMHMGDAEAAEILEERRPVVLGVVEEVGEFILTPDLELDHRAPVRTADGGLQDYGLRALPLEL